MEKDYARWHKEKTRINDAPGVALFREREVWWCTLGANVGNEQDGTSQIFTRPVFILAKFNLDVCLILPLTARPKEGKYYFSVGQIEGKKAVAVLSQIRLIDRKRLVRKMSKLPTDIFDDLIRRVVVACFPTLKP